MTQDEFKEKEEEINALYKTKEFWEGYLIRVGIRSLEYTYTDEELYENIDYFKDCCERGLSAYKALLFLSTYLEEKQANKKISKDN